jgi:hypothetical protein
MRLAPAGQVVLGDSFRAISRGVRETFASGDYLVADGRAPIIINDALGTTAALAEGPGCSVAALGPPWVVISCPQSLQNPDSYGPYGYELYSLADGTRQMATPSPGVPCRQQGVECTVDAVGSYWMEWASGFYHIPTTFHYQNIETGELRDNPANATTFPDLNSASLAERTCPGVRLVPSNFSPPDNWVNPWGSLTYDGKFAFATTNTRKVFLERCGTHMRRRLGNDSNVVWSASVIVWQTARSRLSGLFLPSLQKFTVPLSSAVVASEAPDDGASLILALTSDALYMNEYDGKLWRTASPAALPRNVSGPTVTHLRSTLTCVRGNWLSATKFTYEWRVNGRKEKATKPRLVLAKSPNRRSVSCSVIASNLMGTTTASSAPLYLR